MASVTSMSDWVQARAEVAGDTRIHAAEGRDATMSACGLAVTVEDGEPWADAKAELSRCGACEVAIGKEAE